MSDDDVDLLDEMRERIIKELPAYENITLVLGFAGDDKDDKRGIAFSFANVQLGDFVAFADFMLERALEIALERGNEALACRLVIARHALAFDLPTVEQKLDS